MLTSLDCQRIWIEYKVRVSGYIFSHISNREDAEDLLSSVFTKIVQASPTYQGNPNQVSSFVYNITRNLVIDYYRTKKSFSKIPETLKAANSTEEDFFTQKTLDFLADALALLSKFERDIIFLHYYKNLSLKKIAEKLSLSYGKIKLAHNKAIAFLKDRFTDFEL